MARKLLEGCLQENQTKSKESKIQENNCRRQSEEAFWNRPQAVKPMLVSGDSLFPAPISCLCQCSQGDKNNLQKILLGVMSLPGKNPEVTSVISGNCQKLFGVNWKWHLTFSDKPPFWSPAGCQSTPGNFHQTSNPCSTAYRFTASNQFTRNANKQGTEAKAFSWHTTGIQQFADPI